MIAKPLLRLLIAAIFSLTSLTAVATITTYSNQVVFLGIGSISDHYAFEDVDTGASGLSFMGDPWTAHGITYNTGSNMVIGQNSGFVTSNVFTSNTGLLSGAIGGNYNMFGFDLGTIFGTSSVNITLNTNLGIYSFLNLATAPEPAASFFGFSAGTGEYFTAFSITDTAISTIPALDNVMLGIATPSPVPEPEMVSLLASGLLFLALVRRRDRS